MEIMKQIEQVYKYLLENYKVNEPIFLSEIFIPNMKSVSIRQQIIRLIEDGRLKRFDTDIYYLPGQSMFSFGSMLSLDEVIQKKYLLENNKCCGYISGMLFANQLGITTQVPMVYEAYTNKATTDYRNTTIGGVRVIVWRPYVKVSDENMKILQFLDLMKEVKDISEITGKELTNRLTQYLKVNELDFKALDVYLPFYPDRIYRNLYEVGLLNGVVT